MSRARFRYGVICAGRVASLTLAVLVSPFASSDLDRVAGVLRIDRPLELFRLS